MSRLLDRAVDIYQYDSMPWSEYEDTLQSPNRKWMFSYLSKFNENWKGRVVDIGCGTGWLINEISKIIRRKNYYFFIGKGF